MSVNILEKNKKANLRIMSSNILFDKTAAERVPKLFANYMYYVPDFIGFQEVNEVMHKNLMPKMLANGYSIVKAWPDPENRKQSEKESLSKKYPSVNFFPILYRTDRFEEVESSFRMYRSTWTHTKGFTSGIFKDKQTGKIVGFINTHAAILLKHYNLEGQSDPVEGAKWRADNAKEMIEEKERLTGKYGDIPFFFTGDFNGNENEEYYKTIKAGGMLDSKYTATESASLTGCSYHAVVGELPSETRLPIDHIFVTPNVRVAVHSIEKRQEVLDASDHCMVYADVAI